MNARVFDKVIEVEVDTDTAAHAANDVVCQPVELSDIAQAQGCAVITSVMVGDPDDQGSTLEAVFLKSAINVGANNTAMTISDSDLDQVFGYVTVDTYMDLANNQLGVARNLGLMVEPYPSDGDSTRSVWMALRTTGTPTYAGGKLTVKVGVLRG